MQEVIGAGLGAPSPCRAVPGRRPIGTHRSRVATPMFGEEVPLSRYKDQVLLVVNNVNYPGARALYNKYRDQGFNIIAFPCNQFGGQAPGSSQEEREYAWRKFGFEFDVFDKIEVNGAGTHPIYRLLKQQQRVSLPSSAGPPPGEPGRIEWNYTKFLVGRDGVALKRFKPGFDPLEFEGDVRLLLAGKDPLPAECIAHPGRKVCKVDSLLAA
ncbi:hypothetical protein C2E20_8780 [Micractinium conductrix]|uniref:Glutathione peroxidase n=1 Tax=Micractinium conductrix TaxID=554055 RepID=A0A2P6V0E4_9CHLO|nr:hypothetical protein C2E20_8780 [Micractinium conductrix]|eukprot:PSC67567.1 hypothetical protein C2E20_8780 [Micractinium conductrix]